MYYTTWALFLSYTFFLSSFFSFVLLPPSHFHYNFLYFSLVSASLSFFFFFFFTLSQFLLQSNLFFLSFFHVEERTDSDPCDSNTDLFLTNISVEMDCATGVHMTRSGGYIDGSDREKRVDVSKINAECNIVLFSIPDSVFGIVREWRVFKYRLKLLPSLTEHRKSGNEESFRTL